MSYLSELRKFYPNSWKARWAIQNYQTHIQFEDKEPTTITLHSTYLRYGGPEEGGWWYQEGYPEETHCIFSKKQAIKKYMQLADEYQIVDQPSLGDTTTSSNWELSFSNDYARMYPSTRPHYC
jgi:hypothetical protein